jgi:Tripartite tricarboxylate transporter family receptor
MSVWNALWVPKGTPKEIITKLNLAAMDALADPVVRNAWTTWGSTFLHLTDRRPRLSAHFTRPRSRSGGQSSRRHILKRNEIVQA